MLVDNDSFPTFMAWLERVGDIALDTETTGLDPWRNAAICGISIASPELGPPSSFYLPFRHGNGENIDLTKLEPLLREIERHRWYGWNAKFDLHMLARDGYRVPSSWAGDSALVEDVMFAAHLANENEDTYALKRLADKYLGRDASTDEENLREVVEARFGKSRGRDSWKGLMWQLWPEEVQRYAEADVELTWRMRDYLLPVLRHWRVIDPSIGRNLYDEMNRYGLMFTNMEQTGIQLDQEFARQKMHECLLAMERLTAEINADTDGVVTNPGSSHQVNRYFERKHTTKADLERSLKDHPLSAKLREYRSASKAVGSYYGDYLKFVKPDGRIRPSFRVIGTYTGRLSCAEPNLMAVPRGSDDEGYYVGRVKQSFVASPGYVLAELDLSQAELRVASHYGAICLAKSKDPQKRAMATWDDELGGYLSPMGRILHESGADLHQRTADSIGTDRDTAKRINFSAVFGIGAVKYAKTYGVDYHSSKRNLDQWNRQYPEFRELLNVMEAQATYRGYIQLDTGRVRRYPSDLVGVYDPKLGKDRVDPHAASSNLVQGTVAEIMRKGGLRFDRELADTGIRPLLQVHDSWIIEIPEENAIETARRIRHCMTDFHFSPRLDSDIKLGNRWGALTSIKSWEHGDRPHLQDSGWEYTAQNRSR